MQNIKIILFLFLFINFGYSQSIVKLEYFIDVYSGFGTGTSIPIPATASLDTTFDLDLSSVSDGFHTLIIRSRDSNGAWSVSVPKDFLKTTVTPPVADTSNKLVQVEYFIDTDPGYGNAIQAVFDSTSYLDITFIVDLSSVGDGFHQLLYRTKDTHGNWSTATSRSFFKTDITPPVADTTNKITQLEYFIDTDPGLGQGIQVSISPTQNLIRNTIIDLNSVTDGFHMLFKRVKDTRGMWSTASARPFIKTSVIPDTTTLPEITSVKYYFSKDGVDEPLHEYNSFTPDSIIDINFLATLQDLETDSMYMFHIFVEDENNKESLEFRTEVIYSIANISISPDSLIFGVIPISTDSVMIISVSNSGSDTLDVDTTEIIGSDSLEFSIISGQAPFSILPGGNPHDIQIRYCPTRNGFSESNLRLISNDPDSSEILIYLAGTGIPIINSHLPLQNGLNVSFNSNISIIFATDIDPSTLNNNTINVHGSLSGLNTSSNINYTSGTKTVIFNPNNDFQHGEVVNVILTRGIKTTNGDSLASPYIWKFYVGSGAGSGLFLTSEILDAGSSPQSITAADFDNDNDVDLAFTNRYSNDVYIYHNNDGQFIAQSPVTVGTYPWAITTGDFNSDNYIDLAVVNVNSDNLSILLNSGDGNFVQSSTPGVNDGPRSVACGDFDGDGDLDLVIANGLSADISILTNNGNGIFNNTTIASVGTNTQSVMTDDFDNDGDLDFASANYDANTVNILINDGNLSFSNTIVSSIGTNPHEIIGGDFDSDGDIDIAVTNHNASYITVLKNNGLGVFNKYSTPSAGNSPWYIVPNDMNGDGHLDLVTSNYHSNNISILTNDGVANFFQTSIIPTGTEPIGLITADFDQDTDIDIAVCNYGNNDISVLLNRNSQASISIFPDSLNFGTKKINTTKNLQFKVYNNGTDSTLNIADIVSSNSVFVPNPNNTSVAPGDSAIISVDFTPTDLIIYNDSLTIYSNDINNPQVKVFLSGEGTISDSYVSGTISGETWTQANSPYVVIGDISVSSLVIEPGVDVLFDGDFNFEITGSFTAVGTQQDSIRFMSSPSNSSGWQGIYFDSHPDPVEMSYCQINGSNNSGILVTRELSFSHLLVKNNNLYGIELANANNDTLLLSEISITNNNEYGIFISNVNCFPQYTNLVMNGNGTDAIGIAAGRIIKSGTWQNTGYPYVVTGNLSIYRSTYKPRLTIEAGITIKIAENFGLQVGGLQSTEDGELWAVGTQSDSVIFKALNDSAGGWNGILFPNGSDYNGANSFLKYCRIDQGNTYNLSSSTSSAPQLLHCLILNSNEIGISCNSSSMQIDSCEIINNGTSGIYGYEDFVVSNSIIRNNGQLGIYSAGVATISDCEVESNNTGIKFDGDSKLSNVVVKNNIGYGIEISNALPIISNVEVINNGGYGIYITGNSNTVIGDTIENYCTIINNTNYDIYNDGQFDIFARNNDWGTADTSLIASRIYDKNDDPAKGRVHYKPIYLADLSINIDLDTSGEQSGDIIINYSISNYDTLNVGILCEYKPNPTSTWQLASITGDTAQLSSNNYNGSIEWNSRIDLPDFDLETIRFKITPYTNEPGKADSTQLFHLDNFHFQSIAISLLDTLSEYTDTIRVAYTITDASKDIHTLKVRYQVESQNWNVATLIEDTTAYDSTKYSGTLHWLSLENLPGVELSQVRFSAMVNDGWQNGIGDTTAYFYLDNNTPPAIVLNDSISQNEQSGDVVISYQLNDKNNDTLSIDALYSIDGGTNWHIPTIQGNLTQIEPTNYSGYFNWLSATDEAGNDIEELLFNCIPADNDSGISDTVVFHLDNNQPPVVDLQEEPDELSQTITLSAVYSDTESDSISINCLYKLQGSPIWQNPSISSDTTGILPGVNPVTIIWESLQDISDYSGYLWFKVIPFDIDPGIADSIYVLVDNLGVPVLTQLSQPIGEQSGDIIFDYIINDDESDLVNLGVEYSQDSLNWINASIRGDTSNINPQNYQGSVTWHSDNDLPGMDVENVWFKITPKDARTGIFRVTNSFHVDNNFPPTLIINNINSPAFGIIEIPFQIQDTENDTINIKSSYRESTSSWQTISETQYTQNNYLDTLDWNTGNELGFGQFNNIAMQFIPSDNDTGSVQITNQFDVYNYAGDYSGDININYDDLIVFAQAWHEQDLTKEIGPAGGQPPLLIPQPDGVIDFEDLMVLVQQWNWSYDHPHMGKVLAKTKPSSHSAVSWSRDQVQRVENAEAQTEYLWQKEYIDDKDVRILSSFHTHLLQLEQSEYDPWNHKFADQLIFHLDTTASVLGYHITIEYDSEVLSVAETENMLLADQDGFTFKVIEPQKNTAQFNSIVLSRKISARSWSDGLLKLNITANQEKEVYLTYRWIIHDIRGSIISSGESSSTFYSYLTLPETYALHQNYPNPFNPSTTIRYQLPVAGNVQLDIYNTLGQHVISLVDQDQEAGYHSCQWDITTSGKSFASGLYFLQLRVRGQNGSQFKQSKKILLLK